MYKVKELHRTLGELIKEGKGEQPIMIQVVINGVTYADEISICCPGDPADGDLIWLVPGPNLHLPEWMGK